MKSDSMKKSITKNQLKLLKQQRLFEQRIAKKHEKPIADCYKELAKEVSKVENLEQLSDVDKLVKVAFEPKIQKTLIKTAQQNIGTFIDFFVDKFERNINLDELQTVKSKLLNKTLNKYTAETVKNVTDTTKDILKTTINKHTQQGLSFRDMVKKIVEETEGEISIKRARIIARTETSKAVAMTNHATAKSAGLTKKKWVYTNGSVTKRKFHEKMNGIEVGINEKFTVPGEGKVPETKMRFPKDPECLVAGQIISCSCQIFYN